MLKQGGLARRWATKPITEIDGAAIHAAIAEARRPGSESRGRAMAAAIGKLFAWATQHRKVETNPALGMFRPKPAQSRERVLSDAEVKRVWRVADEFGFPFGHVVKLLLLTAQRRDEIAGCDWAELSADHSILSLPPARTKNKRPHAVPLPPLAREIIASVPRIAGVDFLFSTTGSDADQWIFQVQETVRRAEWRSSSTGNFTTSAGPPSPAWPSWASCRTSSRRWSITSAATRAASPGSTTGRNTPPKRRPHWSCGPSTSPVCDEDRPAPAHRRRHAGDPGHHLQRLAYRSTRSSIGDHDDFRQLIVAGIWRIAALEPVPPHIARQRIERAASHLRRSQQVLNGLGAGEAIRGIDAALKQVEAFTPPKTSRKQLAAKLAYDLLSDWGAWPPSLADDGTYVRLTALLHLVATGKRDSDPKRACLAHVKVRNDAQLEQPFDTGRHSGHPTPEAAQRLWPDVVELHERRKASIAKWPPLHQVIDLVASNPRFFLRAELPRKKTESCTSLLLCAGIVVVDRPNRTRS